MNIIKVQALLGIKNEFVSVLYEAMRECSNKERLLVCLYFMSDIDDELMTHENIEINLKKIFPPTTNKFLPENYKSFQASVIRGQFDNETQKVNSGTILENKRLWARLAKGTWKNTELGNKLAIEILKKINIEVRKNNENSKFGFKVTDEVENAIEEFIYQNEIENLEIDENIVINDKPEEIPTPTEGANGKKRPRSAKKAKNSIVLAKYQCEADLQHKSFNTKRNKNYVEAHHLIPMEFQDRFPVSLDVEANIISLCPLCHRRLHHAIFDEKIDTLKKLYEVRKERVENCGIKVSLKELYEFYK